MKEKIDIQSMEDDRNVTIDKVGVTEIRYPITVDDRLNGTQHTVADLDIFVELPHHHRGTHMSRFLEVLNRYHNRLISSLEEFLTEVRDVLEAERAYTVIRFPYFVKKQAPVSKIESLLSYNCYFEASINDEFELTLGVEVPITTLCPCSKAISEYGAHNQRSYVSLEVTYNEFMWLEDLIDIVEKNASCEIYPLLKRVDEKYVTEKAYDNPVFVEDIVRKITIDLKKDSRVESFVLESENMESIHNHNAYACVKWSREH